MNKNISSEEALKLITENKNSDDFVVFDIRTLSEFESEKINNAVNFDIFDSSFKERLEELDKNKTYLVYCRTGSRSTVAIKIMEDTGFKKIYHLENGIQEWIESGYQTN